MVTLDVTMPRRTASTAKLEHEHLQGAIKHPAFQQLLLACVGTAAEPARAATTRARADPAPALMVRIRWTF
jgi:hypothetical protein